MAENYTGSNTDISVVMISHNRREWVVQSLRQLTQLPEDPPIILVDNASTDGTVKTVQKLFPEVRVIPLKQNRGAIARNIGVEFSTTPYIAFSDDDSWWESGALDKAVKYFEQYPNVGAIAGQILVNDEKKLDPTSALQSISPLQPFVDMPGPAILSFLGCGVIVRKHAYMEVGGYNPYIYYSGEELILGMDLAAAGWGVTYCHDIVGRHYPSPKRNLGHRYRLGMRNRIRTVWMRRPLANAIKKTLIFGWQSKKNIHELLGFVEGLASVPWTVFRQRRVVPWWVEQYIRTLEQQDKMLKRKAARRQRQFARAMQLEVS